MTAFDQPNVTHALCLALVKLSNAPELSASILAEAVAARFPAVPTPVLRVVAAKVLRLYFDPVTVDDTENAGLSIDEVLAACDYFGAAHAAEAASLAIETVRLHGPKVAT